MTGEKKFVQKRLTLLQFAERLGNVSETCRRQGVSRSQFYEYKRSFQELGFEGLVERPSMPKGFANETPGEIRDKVIGLSLEHPAWIEMKISDHLPLEGVIGSRRSVRNIWIKENMETRYKRVLRLEEEKKVKDVELTEEEIKLLERANPCFRERKVERVYPGYLLSQDTLIIGTLKSIGRIYLQAVVDTYGSYAFGKLYTSKLPETAVDILCDRVLPLYKSHGIKVQRILTDNGREYCGKAMIHPYQIYLEFNDIEQRRTKIARPQTNRFVERFKRRILDEFFRETFRKTFYPSVNQVQKDLDDWLEYYNNERPHRGYRNMGRSPIETIEKGKTVKEQTMEKAA